MNVRNAQSLGLLPDVPREQIELCGNTALAGCERLLLSPRHLADVADLCERAAVISLSHEPDFESLFLENLYLKPLKAVEA